MSEVGQKGERWSEESVCRERDGFNLLPPEHSIYAQIRFKLTGYVNYHIFDPKQKSHHHALETY